jgi:quercetin dioxygenase-like cupin family protein
VPGAAPASDTIKQTAQRSSLPNRECLPRLNYEERYMPNEGTAVMTGAQQRTVEAHQPGQDVFKSVLSEDINWKPFPAFPPSVRLAVIVGQPSEAGPYTIRVRVPHGVKLMPHRHPEDRVYTVISGVFYIGLGDQFNPEKLEAYPPGSVIVLPGNTSHFHWAKSSEYVTQVTAIGPLGLDYISANDDPRNHSS